MKWNVKAVLVVVVILAVSFVYSGLKESKLSNSIKEDKFKTCSEKNEYDCNLLLQYHDDCFKASYRAQYRIKEFHSTEYDSCIRKKVITHIN